MRGPRQHVEGLAGLDDAAVLDDRDIVADLLDHRDLMRDQQDRDAELAVNALQELKDRARRLGIERRGRLVAEQDARLGRKRPGDSDALLLPAESSAG